MRDSSSTIAQKLGASAVNCAIVFGTSLPFTAYGFEAWRIATVILFFAYNLVFRARCVGMMAVGTYLERPASLLYISLYTLSFCSMLWYLFVPLDVALVYASTLQIPCLVLTGNTLHALISGEGTISPKKLSGWKCVVASNHGGDL